MIHYTVAFTFGDGVVESDELARITTFLADLQSRGAIAGFRLLRSRAALPDTPRRFKADITFVDDTQFGAPFAEVSAIGVHKGLHGLMIERVSEMSVEVFEEITEAAPA